MTTTAASDALRRCLHAQLEALLDGARIWGYTVHFGYDESVDDGGFPLRTPNQTATITITINGGATVRPTPPKEPPP